MPGFDLAMLFGVMMYLQPEPLVSLMRDVRPRLRTHGTLLVAEPDPEGVVGRVEVAAKRVYAAIKSLWDPTRFTFHTAADTRRMLREAGFVHIRDRPSRPTRWVCSRRPCRPISSSRRASDRDR